MASASFALQQALFARLTAATAVTALLGGARIYDDVPARAEFPYVTFGQSAERDWATGSGDGSEHTVTLHVWSRAAGRKEAVEILDAARAELPAAGESASIIGEVARGTRGVVIEE